MFATIRESHSWATAHQHASAMSPVSRGGSVPGGDSPGLDLWANGSRQSPIPSWHRVFFATVCWCLITRTSFEASSYLQHFVSFFEPHGAAPKRLFLPKRAISSWSTLRAAFVGAGQSPLPPGTGFGPWAPQWVLTLKIYLWWRAEVLESNISIDTSRVLQECHRVWIKHSHPK